MPNKDNPLFAATEGETLAASASWRRKKAKDQPRDANGRWIADGARITYKDELAGKRVAATVVSTHNGKAIVDRDNPDGTTSRQTVPNNTVEVVSSKARLPKDGTSYYAKNNDFNDVVKSKKFNDGVKKDGQGVITRDDGYQLEASLDLDPAEGRDDKKNPISYQLFAPGGKSLGTFSRKAAPSFNDIVDDDKENGSEESAEAPEQASPESGADTLFSTLKPLRVSRDNKHILFKDTSDRFHVASLQTLSIERSGDQNTISEGISWRKPVTNEFAVEMSVLSLAAANNLNSETVVASVKKVTPYRVPAAVKSEIATALSSVDTSTVSEKDLSTVQALASSDSVSLDEVRWIESFLTNQEEAKKLAGGQKGAQWAAKILEGFADTAKHDFNSDKLAYFAVGDGKDGWKVNDILAVDFSTDEVYKWSDEGFSLSEITVEHVDEPVLLPIDEFSAEALAGWIDSGREGGTFNLADIDPIERNMVELALSEMDLQELDSIGAIVASGDTVVDVDGYTPAERSANAKNQPRAGGGKFGTKKTAEAPIPEAEEPTEIKARLEEELPLVEDPQARVTEWLESAPITAAAVQPEAAPAEPAEQTEKAPAPAEEEAPEEATEEASSDESKSLYFAIVDQVDRTAVLDVVAITKNDLHEAEAWKRNGADWVPAPEYMAKFHGTTPPPIVELDVPEPAKAVLAQIDSYDSERGSSQEVPEATETPAPAEEMPVVASSGFSVNGRWSVYSVEDLENAVMMLELSRTANKTEVKNHLRKRAFALNRMDLIPSDWRTPTVAERSEQFMSTSPLYGEHGEVIVAAGVPGIADTPSDWAAAKRLQNYWTRGKGALKIRWGTPGDLTRAHRHLAKYVGPQRAWGLAQKYHKSIFGVYNHTHDVATGQYKPRRRKRR